ncbi:mitochondrial import receptor subunit TOM22 homolog isoform X1 [Spodoptera frugiperda]|uniref:Mitochondrial import receptor subunit TOM22 homolog n=1 Tax=Spodoptera frugiperda TaxID=7108 RepID=A0A9R0E2J2_SPOFR|nr:mitochondrial import receptor subunit TOM22 homolog isoform X1 [Spodoptera frugiperda]
MPAESPCTCSNPNDCLPEYHGHYGHPGQPGHPGHAGHPGHPGHPGHAGHHLGSSPSAGTPIGGPAGGHLAGPLKEYDDEPDETLSERLWGLTEMFPECVRSCTYTVTTNTVSGVKSLYGLSRSVMWVIASSSVILFAPVIFEVERAQMAEMEKSQQKQVLLGTNTAMSGPMPNMPPMPR